MKQENKELLLKGLSARLPYGVKGIIPYDENNTTFTVEGIDNNVLHLSDAEECYVEDFKPYLRPMSSMTEEEFVYFMGLKGRMLQSYEIQSMMKEAFNMPNSITIVTQLYNYLHKMDWLLSKHFDVRGLIPKRLAIEITEKNNPYKE